MSQSNGWSSAQAPNFVAGVAGHIPKHPNEKARESHELAIGLASFRARGGKVEVIHTPSAAPIHGRRTTEV
ncbi:hypothetical protein D7Y39_05045 [Stenotrophomonas maltophilia]|uniref:hypothetical protein n=1 Tax=Stenotrophomonas maltophilia TaxID=40324 RepID=UPI0015DF6B0C|nr:hypothetical protein [Stenotrophomonas maltophilia]MBA0289199.1 hypothetical protein [Stenotrophomonas maltophilia]